MGTNLQVFLIKILLPKALTTNQTVSFRQENVLESIGNIQGRAIKCFGPLDGRKKGNKSVDKTHKRKTKGVDYCFDHRGSQTMKLLIILLVSYLNGTF